MLLFKSNVDRSNVRSLFPLFIAFALFLVFDGSFLFRCGVNYATFLRIVFLQIDVNSLAAPANHERNVPRPTGQKPEQSFFLSPMKPYVLNKLRPYLLNFLMTHYLMEICLLIFSVAVLRSWVLRSLRDTPKEVDRYYYIIITVIHR